MIKEVDENRLTLDIGFGTVAFSKSEIASVERVDMQENEALLSSWKADYIESFPAPTKEDEQFLQEFKALAEESRTVEKNAQREKMLAREIPALEKEIPLLQAQRESASKSLKALDPKKDVRRYNALVLDYNTLSNALHAKVDALTLDKDQQQKILDSQARYIDAVLLLAARIEEKCLALEASGNDVSQRLQFYERLRGKVSALQRGVVQDDIRVEGQKEAIIVTAMLNEKARAVMAVDTGASLMVITKSVAERLGIPYDSVSDTVELILADGRRTKAKFIRLSSVAVGTMTAHSVEAAIIENAPGNGIDGLLGMSFLKHFSFSIDRDKKTLRLGALAKQ